MALLSGCNIGCAARALQPAISVCGRSLRAARARANTPPRRQAPRYAPRSTIRPRSNTRITSALRTVESRWAMTKVVRPAPRALQRRLEARFGAGVERAGGLVEDQDRRVLQQRAGDGSRWRSPPERLRPRSPTGAVDVGDEIGLGERQRAGDLGGVGVGLADAQVVLDRAGEQIGLLQHDADIGAQARQRHVPDVDPVDGDAAGLRVEGAMQQRQRRRFARRPCRRPARPSAPAPGFEADVRSAPAARHRRS